MRGRKVRQYFFGPRMYGSDRRRIACNSVDKARQPVPNMVDVERTQDTEYTTDVPRSNVTEVSTADP